MTEIVFGSPKAQLSKELPKKHNVDLIVCGATGLNVVERFLIGSVSEAIVRHSRCDVVIVRTNDQRSISIKLLYIKPCSLSGARFFHVFVLR